MGKTKNRLHKAAVKKAANKEKVFRILKPVVIILACFAVGFGAAFGITKLVKYNKAKTLQVAFYDLPAEISDAITSVIKENLETDVKFEILDADVVGGALASKSDGIKAGSDSDSRKKFEKITKKYDLIFGYEGAFLNSFKDKNVKIPKNCYAAQPSSFNDKNADFLKVCTSHYEIAYNIEKIKQTDIEYPQTLDGLYNFLAQMSDYVFCPFIMAGKDDKTLLAFLGCMLESLSGTDGYNAFLEEVKKSYDGTEKGFETICQFELPGAKNKTFTLGDILAELKTWPQKGYTHPSWFMATSADVEAFMDTDQVAVVFTSLEEHRKMPYRNVSKYEACRFPVENDGVGHGVISPAVSVVKLQNNAACDKVLGLLVNSDVQEKISYLTMLAPSSSRGQPYDRQADDVRFWNAACQGGPLCDVYTYCFELEPENGASFASQIRNYLK